MGVAFSESAVHVATSGCLLRPTLTSTGQQAPVVPCLRVSLGKSSVLRVLAVLFDRTRVIWVAANGSLTKATSRQLQETTPRFAWVAIEALTPGATFASQFIGVSSSQAAPIG
jgi:hypothetical protein